MDILDLWASFIDKGVPVLGNATLPRVSGAPSGELPYLELVRPGVQRLGNWSVQDTVSFWKGLPLLENKKPSAPVTAQSGGLTDSKKKTSSAAGKWQWRSQWTLLAVALNFTWWLHVISL